MKTKDDPREIRGEEETGPVDHAMVSLSQGDRSLTGMARAFTRSIYAVDDFSTLQSVVSSVVSSARGIGSIDELLERDLQREKDGFKRKVKIGKLIRPGQGGKEKVVVVPSTVEEKFIHDRRPLSSEETESSGGSGDGEEGTVIGEEPLQGKGTPGQQGAGQGEGGDHEIESTAYDLGRILTERFELPNLKEKGKKRSLKRFTYDLTDRNRGFGQVLDKKATLKKIIETNIGLERIPDTYDIDLSDLLVSPEDHIYRLLSREYDLESQALVFFIRDYSGSMSGKPSQLVITQHLFIYGWLIYQYERQVETRFILHDTAAKEVPDFHTYHGMSTGGGTEVLSAYKLVNSIIEKDNLARDYNIYVFHGTDGDDWDREGTRTVRELKKMLTYTNRIGITVARTGYNPESASNMERFIQKSRILEEFRRQIVLDAIEEDPDEARLIEGIKRLIE